MGEDWKEVHRRYSNEFANLFDEEKDFYGDMPTEIYQIMQSYIWHYKNDPWEWIDAEFQLEAELPDGTIYRGKVDSLIRNQFGLWLVDHKTHKTLPKLNFRLLDAQSALYLWAARENGLNVRGFIWNYIRWKAPSQPKIVYKDTRLSDAACDTDFPTMYRTIKRYKADYPDTFKVRPQDVEKLKYLQTQRYEWGKPQTSEFFRRDVLEKSDEMIDRVVKAGIHTSLRLHDYDFTDPDFVERVVERSCEFSCSYTDICAAELMGANIRPLVKQNYIVGDPNDYYNDRAGDFEKEER